MTRTEFGNLVSRVVWGGVRLSPLESGLLQRMVEELPDWLRTVVEAQFEAYNLAQREADGRAINFYRKKLRRVDHSGMPLLTMKDTEAPLLRAVFTAGSDKTEYHAVLTAVNGRAFCLTFDADMRPLSVVKEFAVTKITQSWRSNFALHR